MSHICSFLTLGESLGALSACRQLRGLFSAPLLWRSLLRSHFGGSVGQPLSADFRSYFRQLHGTVQVQQQFKSSRAKRVHRAAAICVSYLPGSDDFLSGGSDSRVVCTRLGIDEPVRELPNCSAGNIMALCPIRSSDRLVVVGSAGAAVVSLENLSPLYNLAAHGSEWVLSACAVPGRDIFITTGYDHTARAWSLRTGEFLGVVARHSDRVMCCAALDGELLITGSNDKTLKLWSLSAIGVEPSPVRTFAAHSSFVSCVSAGNPLAVSAISNTFVSGGYDGKVFAWDIRTPDCVASAHTKKTDTVGAVSLHSDGVIWSCGSSITCSSLSGLRQRYEIADAHGGAQIWGLSVHSTRTAFLSAANQGEIKEWIPAI